ncbi:MAG: hypothetical protein LBF16_09540 [Pseudomonadales bacterium]|jgi:uncharacterized RDD family membrane protein YckC|nr:hypothetical protein [Pseudomonadales bacterium]
MLPPPLLLILLFIPVAMVLILPCVSALLSKQAQGMNKMLWALAALLLSWLGYFIYYYARVHGKSAPR